MRRLTVKRGKTFVGCISKIQFFIEDEAGELVINGVNCKKLGAIKNGEEAVFEIGNEEAKLFAIADKLSREFCNDCYQLPEGEEDITLSGKCKFNPTVGNSFIFDGNDGLLALDNRKKGRKIGLIVLIVSMIVGAVIGYTVTGSILSFNNSKPKDFYVSDMTITLTEGFSPQNIQGFAAAFGSKDVGVFVNSYTGDFDDCTTESFAELVIKENSLGDSRVLENNGLTYFIFNKDGIDGDNYRYYAYVYKSGGKFWLVQFAVTETVADKNEADILKWAESVDFG